MLIGLGSSGLHTNGYSLARKIVLEEMALEVSDLIPELGKTVGDALLAVHRSYSASLRPLLDQDRIHGLAHITGGGIPGNLPRIFDRGAGGPDRYVAAGRSPPLFRVLQEGGRVATDEMFRVFNMGVGMIVITAPAKADSRCQRPGSGRGKELDLGRGRGWGGGGAGLRSAGAGGWGSAPILCPRGMGSCSNRRGPRTSRS